MTIDLAEAWAEEALFIEQCNHPASRCKCEGSFCTLIASCIKGSYGHARRLGFGIQDSQPGEIPQYQL